MKVLVYVRPTLKEFYIKLAQLISPRAKIITISEFSGCADIWLGSFLYEPNVGYEMVPDTAADVAARCRFIRSLPPAKGFELVHHMAAGLRALFAADDFDMVLAPLIDNYTLDLLERLATERGAPYVSLVGHFFDGYCRITRRGELVPLPRIVTHQEVAGVLAFVSQLSYKPSFALNERRTKLYAYASFTREMVKKYLYFPVKRLVQGDPCNYHYGTFSSATPLSLVRYISNRIDKYYYPLDSTCFTDSAVYLPLHFSPEATVDYWCDDMHCASYEDSVIEFISKSDASIDFLVKEHPAMRYRRHVRFYQRLSEFSNVRIIHPYESSNALLERAKAVVVYTGSVGVEALLRGKMVFARSNNYYAELHPNVRKNRRYLNASDLLAEPLNYDNHALIYDILKGLIPARFVNSKAIMNSELDRIAFFVRQYVDSIRGAM